MSIYCNISIEANTVGPDQTAPARAHKFVCEASNILVDDKNIHFAIMRFKG